MERSELFKKLATSLLSNKPANNIDYISCIKEITIDYKSVKSILKSLLKK